MWNLISQNSQAISAVANVLMLLVWGIYLHIFFLNFHSQRLSRILINRGAGRGLDAECLITNMSAEPIYLSSLIASIETRDARFEYSLTDIRELNGDLGSDPRSSMRQGALGSGEYLTVGKFDDLLEQVAENEPKLGGDGEWKRQVDVLELIVVAVHGSEDQPVGARRRFRLENGARGIEVKIEKIGTDQLRSWRQRRKLLKRLKNYT